MDLSSVEGGSWWDDFQYGMGIFLYNNDLQNISNNYENEITSQANQDVSSEDITIFSYQQLLEMLLLNLIGDINIHLLIVMVTGVLTIVLISFIAQSAEKHKYRLPSDYEKPESCRTERERQLIEELWNSEIAIQTLEDKVTKLNIHMSQTLDRVSKKAHEMRHVKAVNTILWSEVIKQEQFINWYMLAYQLHQKFKKQTPLTPDATYMEREMTKLKISYIQNVLPDRFKSKSQVQGDQ